MKSQRFARRLGFALAGLRETWRRERSFRSQVGIAGLVVIALALLRPAAVWWAVIAVAIVIVLATELINTALEALIDHLHPDIHPEIRAAKDILAGAVLLASIGALAIAAALVVSLA